MIRRLLPLSLLLLLASAGAADRGVGIYSDQDLAIPFLNEDRDYTMGIAVEFFWEDALAYPLDPAVARVAEWLGFHARGDEIVRSFMVGSVNYTPDDLSRGDVIVGDRPYASLLYLANKRVRANDDTAAGAELQLGLLGSRFPGEVQRTLHRWWRQLSGDDTPVDPKGWRHQISDGGELTARLRLAYSRLWQHGRAPLGRWDLAHTTTVTLGYQTNASFGLGGRLGEITSPFWTLPFDPINRGNFVPSFAGRELYLWGALRGRAVAYDALLQGQFRDSDLSYGHDQIERLLLEGAAGVTATFDPLQLSLAVNGKSAELKGDNTRREHFWGGLYLMARF